VQRLAVGGLRAHPQRDGRCTAGDNEDRDEHGRETRANPF
jgi:hypothetical protein